MHVLLIHNYYRTSAPSGEDAVVRAEKRLLESHGIEVTMFERHNDDIQDYGAWNRIRLGINTGWSKHTYVELRDLIRAKKPDIAHCHNTFPLISPSAYAACKDAGVPVVQTLHNYRLICPGAMLIRDGKPCEECLGGSLLPALRHRCYRGSIVATTSVVYMLARNRASGVYTELVDRYIALTQFAAKKLAAGGLPASRIRVKPNFCIDPPVPKFDFEKYVVYVGRLSREKGVMTLLKAWKSIRGLPLRILGDGPERRMLEEYASANRVEATFLGFCDRTTVTAELSRSAFMVIPSEWYEGFPMAIVDAYAMGVPVLASDIGSLSEIVLDGVTGTKCEPANAEALASKVQWMMSDIDRLRLMRRRSREIFEEQYSEEVNYRLLASIYKELSKR